jgi:hypothetical protein
MEGGRHLYACYVIPLKIASDAFQELKEVLKVLGIADPTPLE